MEIKKNMMVSLTYNLMLDGNDGEIIEQVTTEKPLQFLFGAGMMLPRFETNIEGLREGEMFEMMLDQHDAYGEVNEEAIVELPKHIFMNEGKFDNEAIREGNTIPMMTGNGQKLNGLVLKISEESVRMDFNHPLAGEDLYFKGQILEVRPATDEEIDRILAGSCGCGSSGCDSGCCSESGDLGCGSGCC
jgi:FKBP-type peptidyl-prolyl cis-trans isomerase SlyD